MQFVAFALMVVGLLGTVLPLVPGLPLIWVVALVAWILVGMPTAGWVAMAILTALLAVGVAAKIVLPARAGQRHGVPRSSLAVATVAAVVGFFVIPIIGFPLGGVAGLYGAEVRRLGDTTAARRSAVDGLRGYGLGVAIEFVTGIAMIVVHVVSVLGWGL